MQAETIDINLGLDINQLALLEAEASKKNFKSVEDYISFILSEEVAYTQGTK